MTIRRDRLEADIKLYKVKAGMLQAMISAHCEKFEFERQIIRQAAPMLGLEGSQALDQYLKAHKELDKIQGDVLRVQHQEMQAQVAIHEAMLAEGERSLVVPGSGMRT